MEEGDLLTSTLGIERYLPHLEPVDTVFSVAELFEFPPRGLMIRKVALLLARKSWFRKFIMSTPLIRDLAGRFVGGDDLNTGLAAVRGY